MATHTTSCACNDEQPILESGTDTPSPEGHQHSSSSPIRLFLPAAISLFLLLFALIIEHGVQAAWFRGGLRLACYLAAYLPVGLPVLREAVHSMRKGDIFSEFLLMSIATIGAFSIASYPEAVAVMLFYAVGEAFQGQAVRRAKHNIKRLLDQRPDEVTLVDEQGQHRTVRAQTVPIGQIVQLKPGEQVALDGTLLSDHAAFNTAALTGESTPEDKQKGDTVLAGMINLHTAVRMQVGKVYADSKLSKILELVQHATSRKAPTELFIRKFARVYTPAVVVLAVLICLLPMLWVNDYQFSDWLYRALIFLVISCPCALVISIPLGYFGGIGAASRQGILFKGSNFLDLMANIDHVVTDKTGTLTEGVFEVKEVVFKTGIDPSQMLVMVNALEQHSTHPVAQAIQQYMPASATTAPELEDIRELPGLGLSARTAGKLLLVGNFRLLETHNIPYDTDPSGIIDTTIAVAYDGQYIGYLTIADRIKADAREAVDRLRQSGVQLTMLSGDKQTVVQYVADALGIAQAYGALLPEDKVKQVQRIKDEGQRVAFVGDGINDAPVIALSDVGIAMGGLGSDAAIETADIVIQDDMPRKIPMAIEIGKATRRIVWQNIGLAFGVKALVLLLGAGGLATMWEAVFADVGVALLAIANAIRIQHRQF